MKKLLIQKYSEELANHVRSLDESEDFESNKVSILEKVAELQISAIRDFLTDNNLLTEELSKKLSE